MGLWDRHVLPRLIETACSQAPMMELRSRYVPRARGRVLEVGIGTGLNLALYGDAVTSVTGVDPAAELTRTARLRAAQCVAPVEVLGLSGESIPADDQSFDTVVVTWTLCSIPNVYRALAEMRRVLKRDGRLLYVEHGRAPDAAIARWQDRLNPVWKQIGGGCNLNRRTDDLVGNAGFTLEESDSGYAPGPKFAAWMYHGVARPR